MIQSRIENVFYLFHKKYLYCFLLLYIYNWAAKDQSRSHGWPDFAMSYTKEAILKHIELAEISQVEHIKLALGFWIANCRYIYMQQKKMLIVEWYLLLFI